MQGNTLVSFLRAIRNKFMKTNFKGCLRAAFFINILYNPFKMSYKKPAHRNERE